MEWIISGLYFLVGGGTGGDEEAVFTLHVDGAVCSLTCGYRDKVIKAEEEDFFEALFQIRQALEVDGLLPFCYGASANVFPEKYRDGEKSRIDGLQGEDGAISPRDRSGRHI